VHSFTQSLRVELKHTRIKVFELAPPATRTPLLTGEFDADDVKGGPVMDIARLASQTINGLKKDQLEIRPGLSNLPVARLRRVSYNHSQFCLATYGMPPARTNAIEVANR
jgi:short-subunit dehydrogenase